MTFEFANLIAPLLLIAFYNKDFYKCSIWNEVCEPNCTKVYDCSKMLEVYL